MEREVKVLFWIGVALLAVILFQMVSDYFKYGDDARCFSTDCRDK